MQDVDYTNVEVLGEIQAGLREVYNKLEECFYRKTRMKNELVKKFAYLEVRENLSEDNKLVVLSRQSEEDAQFVGDWIHICAMETALKTKIKSMEGERDTAKAILKSLPR